MANDSSKQNTKEGLELVRMFIEMNDEEKSALLAFARELLERRAES